jgi:dipeptidyl aminopeptidase/acylaminoacyl peptidase
MSPHSKIARWPIFLLVLAHGAVACPAWAEDQGLLTVAEKSNFQATSRHEEVVDFCKHLAKLSPVVRLGELGASVEGRKLPLIILADPPIASAEEAAQSGKLVVYAQGNIHAGEVDGKEALLMLAREIATAKERPLLKDLVIVFAPIFNADGNERMSKTSRRGQVGPAEGQGVRPNAQGLDLNRDFVKLESPEVRALVQLMTRWNPAIFVDCHTTNGSHHGYTLTYEGPRCPAGDPHLISFVRDVMFPAVGKRLEELSGFKSFFYGNFSRDHTRWETIAATPRYGTLYAGLRNRIGILSESYSYASYHDRILASRDFVKSILEYAAANKAKIQKLLSDARSSMIASGHDPQPSDRVALRCKTAPLPKTFTIHGFVEEEKGGRRVATDQKREYEVQYWGNCEPTLSVQRPYAYLFPAKEAKAVETLQRHGIEVEELREDIELDLELYRLDKITRSERAFQKHHEVSVEATPRRETRRVEAGSVLIRTGQALGDLIVYLLEPQSEDGLVTWNFFDHALAEGKDFPVVRLPKHVPLTVCRVRPLPEDRTLDKPITFDLLYRSDQPPSLDGAPVSGLIWLEDGRHFLQKKDGGLYKVDALTGRAEPFYDPEKLASGLSSLPTINKQTARALAGGGPPRGMRRRRSFGGTPSFTMNPQRTGALFEHGNDLYYCNFDGTKAVRLTKTPGKEEFPTFSPDGRFVAFFREQNLYVVDLATQTERALTTDGAPLISNGKPDWVYGEEIYNYQQTFWWSPDSTHIAFVQFDDRPVPRFTVLDLIPPRQTVENTPYPRAGEPNPVARFGMVPISGGPVGWADLSSYSESSSLIVHGGWMPDSRQAYFYVQDRAQTWLDFCTISPEGGTPTRLFRETTKAWVDNPGSPTFLKDGSFLLPSERTGWKHLYHFDRSGKHERAVTSGEWEARTLHGVDQKSGWVYFSGTRETSLAENLYRVKLDGTGLERLTQAPGGHQINLSPTCNLYVDTFSNHMKPTKVELRHADGAPARTLDTNPVYAIEEYRLSKPEYVQIKAPDGFLIEATILTPPHFDPQRRYPVWFTTYGGPHAPTIHDSWQNGLLREQVWAQMGFVVFKCDPRSASGKGAVTTWSAYRRLGVPELKDIECAITWLKTKPYIDGSRIGMSGHSYGGFMTSYALTHSKLFAAGIAGAPVTDWHNYDTIYTERYMNTPQENPDGYEVTSVVKAARNLHGKLLIAHGIMDDNVHIQNSVQLIQELEQADKDFEVMVYPRSRHGILSKHYQRLFIDFMQRTLKPSP